MESSPLVSIALPAFNSEKTVGQAIASMLLQSYPFWELIFIDDGSSDRTLEIAKKFNDPRIKIYAGGVNKGLPERLNEALDLSRGKYFARMDNDDMSFPDRLKLQVEFLESHPGVDLVGTRAILFNNAGEVVGLFPYSETHQQICRHPWNGFHLPHPTWMGRLDWFRKYRYYNVDRAEDQDLLLRSYLESCFECLPDILFAYRVRDRISIQINSRARLSLLKTQATIFTQRSQWVNLILSITAYFIKTVHDFVRIMIPGISRKRFDAGLVDCLPMWHQLKSLVDALESK